LAVFLRGQPVSSRPPSRTWPTPPWGGGRRRPAAARIRPPGRAPRPGRWGG